MKPPIWDQISFLDKSAQDNPTIACTAEEDRARQEFKDETDVAWLLRKYGALPPLQSWSQGEIDYDLDLLTAKMSVEAAREAYQAFPRELREKLPFSGFLEAVANGSFQVTRHPDGTASAGGKAEAVPSEPSESAAGKGTPPPKERRAAKAPQTPD